MANQQQEEIMLVIKRKKGESFTVTKGGEQITVTVIKKKNGGMTIGVTASPEHRILRDDAKKKSPVR